MPSVLIPVPLHQETSRGHSHLCLVQRRKKPFSPFHLPIVPHITHDFDIYQLRQEREMMLQNQEDHRPSSTKIPTHTLMTLWV